MAATDFIHKTLIGAGSRDAVSNMLVGAGMGAAANTGLGLAQGDFGVIGNATSGALLGAAGGAAIRHAGAKYGSGLMAARAAGEEVGSGLQVSMMTRKVDEPAMDFWGKNTDAGNVNGFRSGAGTKQAQEGAGPMPKGPKAGANTAGTTNGTPVTPQPTPTPTPTAAPTPTTPQAAARSAPSGVGSSFANAGANVGSSKGGYGSTAASFRSNTPVPQRAAPAAASEDGLDGARAAIKRADEWTATQKAAAKQQELDRVAAAKAKKEDQKGLHKFLQGNATKAKRNNPLESSNVMNDVIQKMSPSSQAKFENFGRSNQSTYKAYNDKKASMTYNAQNNAAIEAQARKEMYGG